MQIVLRLTATVRSAFSTALSLVGMYGASVCRCDLRTEHYGTNFLRWFGPERALKGRHVAACQELFGFWPGSDTRA